jgi:DnaA family protein
MMQQLVLELAPPAAPSLENFFTGPNQAAVAALRDALAGGERVVYLFGEPGSGKTHLLRAAVREAEALGQTALYVDAPHAGPVQFPPCDVLAVDDLERLDIVSQLALFDAFNALRAGSGRLFGAGAQPAADLPLREDLRTRLGSGLSLRLTPLSDEEKTAALTWHASRRGLKLAPEIVAYVLTHCGRDMGTQIAVLDALDRHSLQHKRPVTLPLLREALRAFEKTNIGKGD